MRKKILIADNNLCSRTKMQNTLADAGYMFVSAALGEDALLLARTAEPDLVLLDTRLPDLDSLEVLRAMRGDARYDLTPVIILAAEHDPEKKLACLELGADDYITEPFDGRELLSRIRNTLRRIDRSRAANPLTGLRGNLDILREISGRLARGELFAVIYADLDNFKSFNDAYGIARGDIAIRMSAELLSDQLRVCGNSDDFIGHIGGDDFVLITTPDRAERICREIISAFDGRIRTLYAPDDRGNGYVRAINRRGEEELYPIVTLSMAVVTNRVRTFQNYLEVSAVAAELKKLLKRMPGSNYLFDRRKG